MAQDGLPAGTATPFLVGMVTAALSGFAAIWFVLAYLKRHNFNLFVVYRIVGRRRRPHPHRRRGALGHGRLTRSVV